MSRVYSHYLQRRRKKFCNIGFSYLLNLTSFETKYNFINLKQLEIQTIYKLLQIHNTFGFLKELNYIQEMKNRCFVYRTKKTTFEK